METLSVWDVVAVEIPSISWAIPKGWIPVDGTHLDQHVDFPKILHERNSVYTTHIRRGIEALRNNFRIRNHLEETNLYVSGPISEQVLLSIVEFAAPKYSDFDIDCELGCGYPVVMKWGEDTPPVSNQPKKPVKPYGYCNKCDLRQPTRSSIEFVCRVSTGIWMMLNAEQEIILHRR